MNTNDWYTSEARRKDLMSAAQRHQMADAIATSLRQQMGAWLVKTGQRLMEDDMVQDIRTDVRSRA